MTQSELPANLEKLSSVEGRVVPNTTFVYSRRLLRGHNQSLDPVGLVSKISVDGTPKGDHYFRLGLPDRQEKRGVIEVDDTGAESEDPTLKIVAKGLFVEDPEALGILTAAALTVAGVERAVVEPEDTNLSLDFLRRAGGKVVQAAETAGEGHEGQVIAFYPPPEEIIHGQAAAA